jgi:hypothetical protein
MKIKEKPSVEDLVAKSKGLKKVTGSKATLPPL